MAAPATFCITCTTKSAGGVSAIAGVDPHGKPWQLTLQEAAAGVAQGEWAFTVLVKGVEQEVALDVLPALPDCP